MMDEEAPRKPDAALAPKNYDGWSVGDFEAHLRALKAEIARAEAAMAGRKSSMAAADALFRKP